MEASSMTSDHGKMDCCDHGQGAPDHKPICKPGMACQAGGAALPTSTLQAIPSDFNAAEIVSSPTRALPSRPPDRTLRPPISL